MFRISVIGCLLGLALMTSCKRGEEGQKTPPVTAAQLNSTAQASTVQAAAVLTDEKLKAYLDYTRTIQPLAMKTLQAGRKADNTELQKVSEAALKTTGLSISDLQYLSRVTGEYFGRHNVARLAEQDLAAIAQRKADGKPGLGDDGVVEVHQNTVQEFKTLRSEYVKKYGEEKAGLLDKYAPDFAAIIMESLKPAPAK